MTRLIDADDLIQFEESVWDFHTINNITSKVVCKQILTDIQNQPTIEAIPLSFIREEIERLDKCKLKDTADYLREVMKYYDAVQRGEETW